MRNAMNTVYEPFIYRLFFLCTATILFLGCNKPKNTDDITDNSITNIIFDYQTDCLPFDSLFDDVFFVKLETTDKNLIGKIYQVLFTEDKIIVIDRFVANSISVFDMSGKFQCNIGNAGGGPEDYIAIEHVALTPDNKNIVVNNNTKQLKFFEINGKFVKNIGIESQLGTFEFINDKIIILDNPSGNQIKQDDKNYRPRMIISDLDVNKIFYSGFQSFYKPSYFTYTTFSPVKKFNNTVYYNPSYSDTIYKVLEDKYYPYYKLTMKGIKQLIPDESTTNKILDDYHERYPYFVGEFFDLENDVFIRFREPCINWQKFALYSKKQQKSFCCSGVLSNPLFLAWNTPITIYKGNYLVSVVSATEILSRKDELYALKQNLPKGKESMLDDLFRDLTEDENPILFFYRVNIRQNDE
jgi:hypothetical protein